ncbi:MAG: YebC/PmpR family DNA-binding transcriptional regulator, partial [Pseudomonadota bacterium]
NIDRAIKKGTGELEGVIYEEITYEGYGPGGVAVLVEVMTDNRNRTVHEVRHLFEKYGGNLGATGSVGWIFKKRGLISLDKTVAPEDKVVEVALEAGAEDVRDADSLWEVETDPGEFESIRAAFGSAGMTPSEAELTVLPQSKVPLEGGKAESMLKLMNALEDLDDVQNVYANFDIDDALLEELSA